MSANYRGISSILGGFILHLVIGCFYLWGVINIYVTSYYRLHGEPTLKSSLTSGLFPVFLLFVGITFFFGVKLAKKIGLKLVCVLESLLMTLAIFISSFMPDFWSFMFFYAIVYGLGSGLLYLVPIYICSLHFPNKKGLISGIIVSGNGMATLFAGQMSQGIINPNNQKAISSEDGKYFSGDIANEVPTFLKYLSLYFLVLSIIGSLLIMPPLNEINESKQKLINDLDKENDEKKEEDLNKETSFKEILKFLKTKEYLLLFSMSLLSSGFGLMISVQFKDLGLKTIDDDEFLTLIGSIGFVINSTFRIIWGYLMDKFGFKKVYWVLILIQLALICSLNAISQNKSCYFIWICLILACEGGHFSLFPAITMKQFGIKVGGILYPYVYFAFIISNFIQFLIVLGLLDKIHYENVFWIYAGFTCLAGILNYFFIEKN